MFSSYLILLIVPAILAARDLEPETLSGFKTTIHGFINQHLRAEYVLLTPLLAKQNESWMSCRQTIQSREGSCRSCVQSTCGPDYFPGEEMGVFKVPGEVNVDWNEWHKIGLELFKNADIDGFLNMAAQRAHTQTDIPEKKGIFAAFGAAFTAISGLWATYEVGNELVNNWDGFTNTLSNIGSSIGSSIGNVGSSIGNWVSGIFGRRRRDTEMSARHLLAMLRRRIHRQMGELDLDTSCMQQCSECQHFLKEPTDMVSGVCSPAMLMDQKTMVAVIKELKDLYLLNEDPDRGSSVLTKIEYNPDNFRLSSMSFGDVYVTAMTPSGPMTYLSKHRFRIQSPETSAVEMAEELLSKWGL